jgi:hypothetical protein
MLYMANDIPTAGSISHGTLRLEDLVVTFLDFLTMHAPGEARQIQGNALPYLLEGMDRDAALAEVLADCCAALEAIAPEGHFFGAHPGDGADFGFWPLDDPEGEEEASGGPYSGPGGLLDEMRQAERILGTW